MNMVPGAPQPVNITGAAVLAQFLLVVVISATTAVLWGAEEFVPFYRQQRRPGSVSYVAWIILAFALASLGVLVFSDAFSEIWRPILGLQTNSVIPWSFALFLALSLDIVWVAVLVRATGGSRNSVFTSAYFLVPIFAILLREPPKRLLVYFLAVSVAFTITLPQPPAEQRLQRARGDTLAYWLLSIACFGIATMIGYLTRPQ